MQVTYLYDTGCRHEWKCEHCKRRYVVSYHYLNDAWSVQLLRDDGEREILCEEEAERVLDVFPMESALSSAQADVIGPSVWARWKRKATP